MKLYFYILKNDFMGCEEKPYVKFEECEVVEKPKTYYPKDEFPGEIYNAYISKSDIGRLFGYRHNIVVLEEPNVKYAKELLAEKYQDSIKANEEAIAKYKDILSAILEMEE